jgi:WD40 repeat protein
MEFLSSGPDGLLAVELKNRTTELTVASAAANAAPRPLATGGLHGCSFDYAPDGTLALIANNGESPIIAVGAPGHLHEVVRLMGSSPCGIHWSPDGTKLAFASKADSSFRISVIDRGGMPTAQLPYPSRDIGYFEWSPDGREILQSRLDAQGWRLWRVDVAPPFRAAPVLPYGWDWVHMRNGMMFGVKSGLPGIWRIDGIPKRLTDWPSPEYPWAWTMTGDELVYADFFSHPGQRLIVAQPITGDPRTIVGYANDMDVHSLLALNPVNGQVTYNRVLRDDPDIGWIRLARQ